MKKIINIIMIILCIFSIFYITGCNTMENTYNSENDVEVSMFITIQESNGYNYYDIVYHRDTKVMYAVSDGQHNRGVFTLLVNTDGTPMVYESK